MSYSEANAYLEQLGIDAMKSLSPSLERIEALCKLMGHPESQFPAIHITGTNGKSSVARMATALLQETGLKVGTFTSPHLETVRERICFGGVPIEEDEFGAAFDHLHPFLLEAERQSGQQASYFETLVAMFLLWGADRPIDVAVVEVGLGGRWDATNVVRSPVSVVTNISLDHTEMLGGDRPTIAKEKSGIIKPGSLCVTGERSSDVLKVISDEAEGVGAEVVMVDRDFGVIENNLAVDGRYMSIRTRTRDYEGLFIPLHGSHQAFNTAVALEAVTSFLPPETLDDELIEAGLSSVVVPGRMEKIGSIILDVAHNPSGMSALVSALLEGFAFDETIFVVGFLDDKDYPGMLSELSRVPCRLIATRAASPRAVDPNTIATAAADLGLHCSVEESVSDALSSAIGAGPESLVCVTGSHYVVGEARRFLLRSPANRTQED